MQWEPKIALDGGLDGLDFYRKIADQAPLYLKEDGYLLFETGCEQKEAVCALLTKDFTIIKSINDLAGRHRGVLAQIKPS